MQAASPAIVPATSASYDANAEARRKREEATFNPPAYFRSFIQRNHGNMDQERYNRRSLEIVNAAAEAVKADLRAKKKDPTIIFRSLLERLACERQQLAKELGTNKAELFGKWMDRDGSDSFLATSLGEEQYQRYGNRILEAVQKRLKDLIREKKTAFHENDKEFWKGWGDNTCRVYVKVIGANTIARMAPVQQGEALSEEAKQKFIADKHDVLIETKDGIKITCADLGKGLLLANNWYQRCPEARGTPVAHNLKNAYILMTVVLKVGNTWQTMTSYLTWAFEDHPYQLTEEIIDRMGQDCIDPKDRFARKQSQIVILHHCKKEKIDAIVNASAIVFADVAAWDGKDTEKFNRWINDIDYNIVELNPWIRGTGAIVKNLEAVMRKIHEGYELVPYHPEKCLDLEVHANPFKPNFLRDNPMNYVQDPTSRRY